MVTNTEGYIHIIEYLTEHLSLFENRDNVPTNGATVMEEIESQLSSLIINVCSQNEALSFNQRNTIIREVDAIVYDLEEILSGVVNNHVSPAQLEFIKEWAMLIKNLFDTEIHAQMLSQPSSST
ncbi:DUF3802 family protein [Thalassotalea sp. PLHSN55]|uniref:DUF3802 family protein n=1 Tax=Thalassotalea sp. PLHSN55 TaxID=3435888 RepID=UPI003F87DFAE